MRAVPTWVDKVHDRDRNEQVSLFFKYVLMHYEIIFDLIYLCAYVSFPMHQIQIIFFKEVTFIMFLTYFNFKGSFKSQ